MTQKQFEKTLRRAVEDAHLLIQQVAPVRSGMLKASIELVATPDGYMIKINAPHMPYTEEKWISDQWRGRQNPNEGWFREASELAFRLIRARLSAAGSYKGAR